MHSSIEYLIHECKKVLLCEHKKHTTCCVASTCSAGLSPGVGRGYPIQSVMEGTPGYPLNCDLGPDLAGVRVWRWGTQPERAWDQWKYYGMEILWNGYGVTPPPPHVNRHTPIKKYLPHSFGMHAVLNLN